MKLFKKTIAIILCVLMVMSVASCGGDTSWVAKTDKTTINSGLYMYYLLMSYSNAYYMVEDTSKNILTQTIDGVKGDVWIEQYAQDSVRFSIAVMEMFEEKGLELSDESKDYIKQYADYYWAYSSSIYTENGISYDTLSTVISIDVMTSQLFEHIYGKGGEKEITTEAMKEALVENYAKINEVGISLAAVTGDMRSEELQATLKEKANEYKTRIEAGEKIEDLIKEHYNYEMGIAAEEYGTTLDDLLSDVSGEVDTSFIVVSADSTNYSDNEKTEIFKLETGDVTVVVEKEYIRVIQRFDILEDDTYLEAYDYDIRVTLKGEEFTNELAEIGTALELEVNESALKKYKPSKIKA